jgi:formyltetrahydrofolate deformylase
LRVATTKNTAVMLLSCPGSLARKGAVAAISNFLIAHKGSILHADDHQDTGLDLFLSRLEWDLTGFDIPFKDFDKQFRPVADRFLMKYRLALTAYRLKVAVLVSSYDHCLADLLYRQHSGELSCEIPLIISNHTNVHRLPEFYGVAFHPTTDAKDKGDAEQRIVALLGQHEIDLVILARYMQILSSEFVQQFPWRIINIHHFFLPAFVGAKSYQQAFERGVKLIGATSHYVYRCARRGADYRAGCRPRFPPRHCRGFDPERPRLGEGRSLACSALAHREPNPPVRK